MLLKLSEDYVSNLIRKESQIGIQLDSIISKICFLDPSQTDLELMEIWNELYDKYGNRMEKFKKHWERENLKSIGKEYGQLKDEVMNASPLKVELPHFKIKLVDNMG
jgi:hypothetical protein